VSELTRAEILVWRELIDAATAWGERRCEARAGQVSVRAGPAQTTTIPGWRDLNAQRLFRDFVLLARRWRHMPAEARARMASEFLTLAGDCAERLPPVPPAPAADPEPRKPYYLED
jgi:hypothetical protein